ncbi:serine hydrolase-domain-containing protein [Aspergillus lucknowensis]|uniref:Serine hydrolase-domain-containing protein n=1 Tax=Aspergillus lucknowensis TaxID=176173 RepID=A0ABR4M0K7_9EURO
MDLNTALPKFRILLIHGFAADGSYIEAKTGPITRRVVEQLTPDILSEFPGGVELLSPNAPMILEPPVGFDSNEDESETEPSAEKEEDDTNRGWWYGRDLVSMYKGVEASLSSVAEFIYGRPVHGIIGFSQGAAMAGMVCSLLDCHNNPAKVAAIRAQGLPVDDYLALPGQDPLRFMIGIAGYRGTLKYYGSLYQWPMQTPSIHTLASMDAVVENQHTIDFAHSFQSYEIVEFFGSHFIPRDPTTVNALVRFAVNASLRFRPFCWPTDTPSLSQSVTTSEDGDCGTLISSSYRSNRSMRTVTVWKRKRKTYVTRGRRLQAVPRTECTQKPKYQGRLVLDSGCHDPFPISAISQRGWEWS